MIFGQLFSAAKNTPSGLTCTSSMAFTLIYSCSSLPDKNTQFRVVSCRRSRFMFLCSFLLQTITEGDLIGETEMLTFLPKPG